ncbi:MAG: hypothetical protein ACREE9_12270 [Stellaceae bacterium]
MRAAVLAIAALLLAGCASGSAPAVSLAQVQAEGNAIVAALKAGAAIYSGAAATTPAEAVAVGNVLAVAQASNAVLQGTLAGENTEQAVETAGQDIAAVLAVMPIDPLTKVAIDAGIAVLDTFIAEQGAVPAATLALGAAPARVAPPVPIPMPHRLP